MKDLTTRLEECAREKLTRAFAPKSKGVLQSALVAFAAFAAQCPDRVLFYTPSNGEGMNEHALRAHNEWTLILFATFLTIRISRKTGKPVCATTISSYVSLIKGFFSFRYAFTLVADTPRLSRFIKVLQDDDPMAGIRRKRRALRRRHLRKAWSKHAALRATTPHAVNLWAALTVAWHVLARGGEVCEELRAKIEGPRRSDLSYGGVAPKRWACMMLRPMKKRGSRPPAKVPQYIQEHDGGGSDAFAALDRLEKHDPVPAHARASTPMFRLQDRRQASSKRRQATGSHPLRVAELRAFVRTVAVTKLGMGPKRRWGAHSPRIGGATDLMSTGGSSPVLLQAKGRWGSDIGKIYARMTRRMQLAASSLMQQARGRDLEELLPDFTQAA